MIRVMTLVSFVLLFALGCGPTPQKQGMKLEDVPENIMKIARDKLPGVKFDRAVRKPNGEIEILGKDAKGKIREIDITPEGVVTEIE